MSILKDVIGELVGMFIADARLTVAILVTVGLAAVLEHVRGLAPLVGGAVLLAGCILMLFVSVRREAVRRGRGH